MPKAVALRWAAPTARLILPASAPRPQWLAARRRGLGGSDASTIVGLNPHSSRYALWLDKTGRGTEQDDNEAMEWGRRQEPVIRQWFTDTTGIPVRRAGLMQSKANPFQLVSLDGMAGDGGICEWKTTSWRTDDAEVWQDGDVPDHAELQVQHGLAVTGRSHAHCVVLIDGRKPLHRVIQRDDKLIAELAELERAFWADYVIADVEPPLDASTATSNALKARYSITDPGKVIAAGPEVDHVIARLNTAKLLAKQAESQAAAVETELRALLGDAEALAILGEERLTLKQNGTFSSSRFAKDHPDLAADLQRPSTVLDTGRLKVEHLELYTQYRARVLRISKPKKGA